jgi:hypothetical protein
MADLVPYRTESLVGQQYEYIEHIVHVTQAVQRELSRVHSEGARMAIETLTYTRERIQAAARNGLSQEKVAALVEEQQRYLAQMREIAMTGSHELTTVVSNLPALPGS